MSHSAILLLAHGTPNRLSEMSSYLQHVTSGRPMPQHVIEELQHRYAEIGLRDDPLPEHPHPQSRPPLTRWTLRQAELLEDLACTTVYVGMRNWHPFIADTVAQMKKDGVTHARVLCLAPQNSRTSTGLYKRALEAAVGDAFTFDFIAGWADEPLLALAFAERLWPTWAEACAITRTRVPIVFTAHSVPCRTILSASPAAQSSRPERAAGERNGETRISADQPTVPADGIQDYGPATAPDPYPVECKQTAAAVAKLLAPLGMTGRDWYFAFQSQGVAGAPWIGPPVEDTLKSLSEAGHRAVVIQPIGFLCDHVEILYDIDINFRNIARSLSMVLWRPDSLNDSPTLIRALAHVLYGDHALSAPSPTPVILNEAQSANNDSVILSETQSANKDAVILSEASRDTSREAQSKDPEGAHIDETAHALSTTN
jgi:protoporphyrin/coproporphyrin ferrochelatase